MGEFDNRFGGKNISFRDAQLNYRREPLRADGTLVQRDQFSL